MASSSHLRFRIATSLASACFFCASAWGAPATVTVENQTRPTACAEEDNVSMTLSARGITRFRVEALPPPYLADIKADVTAPDFSNCNFDGGAHPTDPSFPFKPRRVVFHDGKDWMVVGLTLPSFWRPHRVPVRVGKRTEDDIHLLQVYAKKAGAKPLEALVMYPADGYWRLKPLPLARFGDGVYGSSFLMGPVETDGRPVVNIASIDVSTQPLAFHVRFADGGRADVKVAEISEKRTALDVSLKPATRSDRPFAMLRSMYVAADNADMSAISWQASPTSALRTQDLPSVSRLEATMVRFGRTVPSRHNTSAPDIRFSRFEAETGRSAPKP
ncbi:hypothetical protein QTH90_18220 [Variovorax sp. J2P1-59]|uniref:hypothetical protein n=1 Tax=Variovorax flavidus TaxID=3053501 RepID=UPI002577FABF|nr:hypothetical protein [Variovorax sp. J2P1-59]MDM0076351.1 hypothetical protein [Variovorax sp. J2P1-59]